MRNHTITPRPVQATSLYIYDPMCLEKKMGREREEKREEVGQSEEWKTDGGRRQVETYPRSRREEENGSFRFPVIPSSTRKTKSPDTCP